MNEPTAENTLKKLDDIAQIGLYFDLTKYLNRGLEIYKEAPVMFSFYTFLLPFILVLAIFIPFAIIFVYPPLVSGFYFAAKAAGKHEQVNNDVFYLGFQNMGNLVIAYIVTSLIISLGFAILFLPGIFLLVSLVLVTPFVALARVNVMDAITYSVKIVYREWFQFFVMLVVLALINVVGFITAIGWLFTVPFSFCVVYAVYEEILDSEIHTPLKLTPEEEAYFRKLDGN